MKTNVRRKTKTKEENKRYFTTEYGAGLFPGHTKTVEGAMKSMWGMIVERREYNNGVVYDKRTGTEHGRIRPGKARGTWIITCSDLMKGRKFLRRVK